MKKIKLYIELYYPVILSFLSFLYSVSLWFSGNNSKIHISKPKSDIIAKLQTYQNEIINKGNNNIISLVIT